NGLTLSDFYTPSYFDPVATPGVRYSYTGAIKEPRSVLRGGYLSWHDLVSDEWWQERFFDGAEPEFVNLGKLTQKGQSLRAQIDRLTAAASMKAMMSDKTGLLAAARVYKQAVAQPSSNKAQAWRKQIEELKAAPPEGGPTERRRPPRR